LNPRKRFSQAHLVEMADSIRARGVQVPLKARPADSRPDGLEIIWGERRWRGAMLVYQGYEDAEGVRHDARPDLRIPVLVESMDDAAVFELMMLENLQRQDLAPSEEAAGYERMMDQFGLSMRQVADRLGMDFSRVQRVVRLLNLPNAVLDRVDTGDLPMYVALEALRVPAEWLGGEARMEALRLAEDAGNPARARELVEARWLRPAREAAVWESDERLAELEEKFGEDVERLSYRASRDLWPAGVTALTAVTAGNYVVASEVPTPPTVHFATPLSWGEMARLWGAPLYAGCDGAMGSVLLTRADLVADAARTRHTLEVSPAEVSKGVWAWWEAMPHVSDGDRVALLKLSGSGDVPAGYLAGRIYVVTNAREVKGKGQFFDLAGGSGGAAVPLHGGSEARLGLLEVSRCPFLPGEGRVAAEALRMESAEAGAASDSAARARRAKLTDLVGRAAMAIRGSVATSGGDDGLLSKAVQFLAVAGAIGASHEEHPGNRLMALLELPEEEEGVPLFAPWEGLGVDRAGAESFAVCAWLLYWLEQHEGADLERCERWTEVARVYGV
jgi:ParB-like chromosome segregation protein Spo0J